MRKIIGSKRYNTETATLIATWSSSYPKNDLNYCEEHLYLTAKGNWFIHGIGNAGSHYSKPADGNASTGSEDIIPYCPDEARLWLSSNDFIDEVETYFPDWIEDA